MFLTTQVPDRLVNAIFDAERRDHDAHLGEREVERLVWSIEQMRSREALRRARAHSNQLLAVASAEDFTRIVGDRRQGWFGLPLMLPNAWYVQYFDLFIMLVLLFVFTTLPICLAFDRTNRAAPARGKRRTGDGGGRPSFPPEQARSSR